MSTSSLISGTSCKRGWVTALCMPFLLLASCRDTPISVCTAELTVVVESSRQTLRVGDTTTASASATTCGGTRPVHYVWRYSSSDSTIARIDSVTGLVRAAGLGNATIRAERNAIPMGFLAITVTP
ncbi:Ig-like domain-containing protein [Gemmatimonas aurantiaca]|uniref:Ig-like domain-containing protein n=1 Tax=Gemmatimonas aurantiaca TaxID=173480 RepID=UPI0012EAF329